MEGLLPLADISKNGLMNKNAFMPLVTGLNANNFIGNGLYKINSNDTLNPDANVPSSIGGSSFGVITHNYGNTIFQLGFSFYGKAYWRIGIMQNNSDEWEWGMWKEF